MTERDDIRAALLITGGGSTAESVIKAHQEGRLERVAPIVVIASRPDAEGIQKAQNLGVRTEVVHRKAFFTKEEFGKSLLQVLRNYRVDLISQNGWLPLTPEVVVEEYKGRIINQHPVPLDPGRQTYPGEDVDFGGKGMHGTAAVCTRIAYALATDSDYWTEATTHLVTPRYDEGELVRTSRLQFDPPFRVSSMNALRNGASLKLASYSKRLHQKELLPLEHHTVIETLFLFGRYEKLDSFRRDKPLVPETHRRVLKESKALAMNLFPHG